MAAHATTVTEYCAVLGRSKLIPESEVSALQHRWKQEAKGVDTDLDSFRKYLVSKRFLTEYQAALIQRGRADGFFIGGYVILDRIGKGASAGVYKAVHTSGQTVALKVMPSSRSKDPNVLNRFQREGRLLTQLDHPNVVRAFQVGQSGNLHFIVMEHLDGETLDEVLARRKKLPPAEAVRLIHQALQGLQHLHDKRMVHRDLKPANLMVTPPGGTPDNTLEATVKILDIGIGRELFDDESPVTQDMHLTSEGAILGTPDYLAPEQARDARSADIRADIYSLGCVLFQLMVGRLPFTEKNVMAQMVKHATEKIPTLASLATGVPNGLQEVFDKLTAKKVDERYQTPAEAVVALSPFLPEKAAAPVANLVLPAFKEFLDSESASELPIDSKKFPALPKSPTGVHAPLPASPAKGTKTFGVPPALDKPKPKPAATADDDSDESIDVELVNLPTPAVPPKPTAVPVPLRPPVDDSRPLTELNRRDFVMLGFGAGGVLFAIGVGYALARQMKRPPAETDPKDEK